MNEYSNILTISGEGRNVGKTLLACDIIAKFSRTHEIIGLKITHHVHQDTRNAQSLEAPAGIGLFREEIPGSKKDTERMLAAGATESYLLLSPDPEIDQAVKFFMEKYARNRPVVCESGRLSRAYITGVNLFVRHLNCRVRQIDEKDPGNYTDRIVTFAVNGFDMNLDQLSIVDNCWTLKST